MDISERGKEPRQFWSGSTDNCNTWVDCRNTDNLKAMREVAVYLMAEETGNEATRQLYKERIKRYVLSLYQIGQGEWDSENYLGHAVTTYVNLYDFAKDSEVKSLAKSRARNIFAENGSWIVIDSMGQVLMLRSIFSLYFA